MPKYASFDHTQPAPRLVTGYYDTDAIDYATMRDPADLFEMTEEQWAARVGDPTVIDNGVFVVLPPPPLNADQEFSTRQQAGIAITCTSTPAIDATYSLMSDDFALVGSIARDAASGLGLPHGAATVAVQDIGGTPHDFTETNVIALYKAERDLLALLGAQRDVMAGGGTPAWPPQTATIP